MNIAELVKTTYHVTQSFVGAGLLGSTETVGGVYWKEDQYFAKTIRPSFLIIQGMVVDEHGKSRLHDLSSVSIAAGQAVHHTHIKIGTGGISKVIVDGKQYQMSSRDIVKIDRDTYYSMLGINQPTDKEQAQIVLDAAKEATETFQPLIEGDVSTVKNGLPAWVFPVGFFVAKMIFSGKRNPNVD